MAVRDWHPAQLGIFWLLVALFGFPMWLLLSLGASALTDLYPYRDWFGVIPIVLAFLVVFAVVALGLSVTWKWSEARQAKPQE
jgi:hypothetical protein